MSPDPRQQDEHVEWDQNSRSSDRDIPEWDDEYLDRVADQLKFNYDLRKDEGIHGERFPLYGRLKLESHKQFFHPALSYARQTVNEHLFARRVTTLTVADVEQYVALGKELADDWVDPDEEHRGTEFTFALIAPDIPTEVRSFVEGLRERTLLRFGYHGHYEINMVVVSPEQQDHAASRNADVWRAFTLWESPEQEDRRLVSRLAEWLRR